MRFFLAIAVLAAPLAAQETKPVPKDSVRLFIPGCARGYIFTAGPRSSDQPASLDIPEGMHLRMNGPKKIMADIKAHQGSMIEITGLMKKGQYKDGIAIGGGIRISPGSQPSAGSLAADPAAGQIWIDVENWRPIVGACPSR
jgi:hypothetical protein